MALKAGYKGIKKYIADKLNRMNPGDSFATDAEIAAAVEATVEEVTDLIKDTVGWVGGNLITELHQGTINPDGSESPNTARVRTGYIPVVEGVTYTVSGAVPDKTVQLLLYRYNSNKQLISQITGWVDSGYSERVTVASYIRVVFKTSDGSNITPSSFTSVDFIAESVEDKKADISALGTQEGATASKLYHVGEHFYKDGKFCTVIGSGDVALGTTWTLNTNYVEGTIADNLTKQATFEGTTSSTGSIKISDSALAVTSVRLAGRIAIPYILSNQTYLKILDRDTLEAVASASVSGRYFYI